MLAPAPSSLAARCRARHPNHCAPLPAPAAGSPCHRYRCHRGVDGERALELIQGPEVPQPPPSIQGEQGVEGAGPRVGEPPVATSARLRVLPTHAELRCRVQASVRASAADTPVQCRGEARRHGPVRGPLCRCSSSSESGRSSLRQRGRGRIRPHEPSSERQRADPPTKRERKGGVGPVSTAAPPDWERNGGEGSVLTTALPERERKGGEGAVERVVRSTLCPVWAIASVLRPVWSCVGGHRQRAAKRREGRARAL